MGDFEDAILYLRKVKKSQVIYKDELFCANKFIFHQAYKNGLDDESMTVVADALKINTLPLAEYKELMHCLVPVTYVPESVVVDMALWILSCKSDVSQVKMTAAIQWLTGVIGNGLTKTDKLETLYNLFFQLLLKTNLDSSLCPLIQLLTKPHLIKRMHVVILNKVKKNKGKKKQYDSLLSVIKHMQPQLVPEDVPGSWPNQCLLSNLPGFLKVLMMAKRRCNQEENHSNMNYISNPTSHREKVHSSLIPPMTYLRACQNHRRTLHEFHNWESLGACALDVEMPSQSLSLLRCHFGLFSLAFGGPDIQRRFSCVLYSTLHNVFLKSESDMSSLKSEVREGRERHLLQQLATLQEYLSQPVPVVSNFLAKYLPVWSGETYCVSILRLLSYIHFSSFEELKSCILDPLYLLFVSGDVEFKSSIINMFKEFMKNLILKEKWREGEKPPFLGLTRTWDAEDVYPKLFDFISVLIETGLSSENGDSFLLYTALSYYHLMASIQQVLDVEYLVIPPPAVMYHSLFSHSLLCLSQSCSLLVRYRTEIYPSFSDSEKRKRYKEELGHLGIYADDYVRILCLDKPLSNRSSSYIFQSLSDVTIKKTSNVFDINSLSSLRHHPAFFPYCLSLRESNMAVTYKALYQITEKKYPGISNFIRQFGPPRDSQI